MILSSIPSHWSTSSQTFVTNFRILYIKTILFSKRNVLNYEFNKEVKLSEIYKILDSIHPLP